MAQLLDDKGSYVRERRPLWPYFLILALLLNFIEVAMRKGHFRRLTAWLQRRLDMRRKPEPGLTGLAAGTSEAFKPVRA